MDPTCDECGGKLEEDLMNGETYGELYCQECEDRYADEVMAEQNRNYFRDTFGGTYDTLSLQRWPT